MKRLTMLVVSLMVAGSAMAAGTAGAQLKTRDRLKDGSCA